jgi:hypothetical protein
MNVPAQYNASEIPNKRTGKLLNQFWIGFIIYSVSYTLMITDVASPKISYLQLLGLVIFIIPAAQLIKFNLPNKYLQFIFLIYGCWLIYIVSRGFKFNSKYLFNTLIDARAGIFLYLAPLILLFPRDIIYLKKVIYAIFALSIIYFLADLIFIKRLLTATTEEGHMILEDFSQRLLLPSGFILLTISYHINKRRSWKIAGNIWMLFILCITLFLALIKGRRGLSFITIDIFLFSYIIYNYANKRNLFVRFFPFFLLFYLSIYGVSVFQHKSNGIFSTLTSRLTEDTRSNVEEYFYIDMDKNDWILGRGIDGNYYCPSGATDDGYRTVIETDYLQIILNGGVISLTLLLLVAIPAIIMGVFYSKNILCKACATWILLWVICLYPTNITTFSLNYLLVWISIGICYSKNIRNMEENLVRTIFNYKLFNPNTKSHKKS